MSLHRSHHRHTERETVTYTADCEGWYAELIRTARGDQTAGGTVHMGSQT